MNTLTTAEELFIQLGFMPKENQLGYDIKTAMVEFAKLHVEAALKAASENVYVELDEHNMEHIVNKESILNSYSLDNIK